VRKRLEAKLQQVKQTLRARMHEPVPKVGEWLGRVVEGFYQYHAVPGNWASLHRFREHYESLLAAGGEAHKQGVDGSPVHSVMRTLAATAPAGASLS
jgi:hypothetical protein